MVAQTLELKDVSVSYAGKTAIHGIDFSVCSGEIFGLIGLNGAGKTTMIKSILGLREYDSGEIRVLGQPHHGSDVKHKVCYLPEKFEPPWFLNGREFFKFSMSLYKQPYDEDAMYAAAERLALDRDALGRRVQTYSKGMRQKLGLMGTLLTGSSLVILDEPMSGLDPLARSRVKDMIVESKSHDKTIFLSSHVLADMDEICDRVALLHQGTLRYVGAPSELKALTKQDYLEHAFLEFIEKKNIA